MTPLAGGAPEYSVFKDEAPSLVPAYLVPKPTDFDQDPGYAAVDDGASAGPAYLVPQTLNPDYEESTPETEAAAADPSTPGPTSTTTKLPPNVAVTAEGAVRYLIPLAQDSTHSRVRRDQGCVQS